MFVVAKEGEREHTRAHDVCLQLMMMMMMMMMMMLLMLMMMMIIYNNDDVTYI